MALRAVLLALVLVCAAPAAAQEGLAPATQALFQAVELNDMAAVETSLADGADPMARNAQNQTPADLAVQKGHFKIAHFLLAKRNGGTPRLASPAAAPSPATPAPAAPPAVTAERPAARPPSLLPELPPPPGPTAATPPEAAPKAETAPKTAAAPPPETVTRSPHPAAPAPEMPEIATAPPRPPAPPPRPAPAEAAAPPAVAAAPSGSDGPAAELATPVPAAPQPPETAAREETPPPSKAEPTRPPSEVAQPARPEAPLAELPPPPGADPSLPALPPLPGAEPAQPPVAALPTLPAGDSGLPALPPLPGSEPGLLPLPEPKPGVPTDVRKPLARPPALRPALESMPRPTREPDSPADAPPPPAMPAEPVEPKLLAGQEAPPRTPQRVAVPDEPMQEYLSPQERVGRLGRLLDREVDRDPAEILDRNRVSTPDDGLAIGTRLTMPEGRGVADAGEATATPQPAKPAAPPPAAERLAATEAPPPTPDTRPAPPEGPDVDIAGTPASRLLDRFAGREENVYATENEHGLPLAVPMPERRPAMAGAGPVPAVPPAEAQRLDTLAAFFSAEDPALGARVPKGIRREQLAAPDPGLIDTLTAESDPALRQTVPDSMLDLAPYTDPPSAADGRPPAHTPNPAFMEKLAEALTPEGMPLAQPTPEGGAAPSGEAGGLGLEQLDVPPGQLARDRPPVEDPWTMTIEQATGDGNRTIAVKSIDPASGELRPKQPDTGIVAGMVGKVNELFAAGDDGGAERTPPIQLDDEERLNTAERLLTEALRAERPAALPPSDQWPVTDVQMAARLPDAPAKPPESSIGGVPLVDVTLALGESVTLSNTVPPAQDGIDPNNECIKKNRATTLFCIEPVDWPPDVRATFVVPTILYAGAQAITRYDQGAASRFHALFPSEEYETVVSFFQARYGEPTDIWKRSIAPLAKPRQDNPTVAWQSRDSQTNAVIVLEVRKFDDTRGGFPDVRRGAVMLYYRNAPTIFPQVSSHELMRLRARYE